VFASALRQEPGVHFVATSYGQWQAHRDGHLGYVAQAIRNAFAEATRRKPSILFIDEIDALPSREDSSRSDDS
jgi:cell division protease FtsH